jgi:hypothetical protein
MAFSQIEYDAVIDRINSATDDLKAKIQEVVPAAQAGIDHWYVPAEVGAVVLALADKAVELAGTFLDKVVELLEGVGAPVLFFGKAYGWTDVKGVTTGVTGELSPTVMPSGRHWSGAAQQAYASMIPGQAAAAARLSAVSDSTTDALDVCAGAGLAFYTVIGIIVAQFIVALVAVISALGSVAFSWTGVVLALGEASLGPAAIATAIGALGTVLGAQAATMNTLHSQVVDNSTFPGGKWPDPGTSGYNYAS